MSQNQQNQSEPENQENLQPSNNLDDIFSEDALRQIVEDCKEIILDDVGKLRKTLDKTCPNCGEHLQLRVCQESTIIDGVECLEDVEIIVCKNLDYEEEVEPKEKRKQKYKRNSLVETEEQEAIEKKNARNTQSRRPPKRNDGYRGESDRKRFVQADSHASKKYKK